jgi:cobalt-zinc-cadmium resistance protein CzcA
MRQRVENEVTYRVSGLFYQLLYLDARHQLILRQDTLYGQLVRAATLRYNTGEGTLLDKLSAETQWNEIRNQLRQNEGNKQIFIAQLAALLNTGDSLILVGRFEELLTAGVVLPDQNPGLQYMQQQTDVALRQQRVQAARFLPDITVGYFNQSLIGFQNVNGQEQYFDAGERFQGFQIGLSLPLWFVPNSARLKAASLQTEKARKEYESYQTMLSAELTSALRENEKAAQSLSYYTQSALPNARQLVRQSNVAFVNGEIDYTAHLLNLRNGLGIEESHLASLNDYQQSVLKINYLTGNLTGTK